MISYPIFRTGPYGMMLPNQTGSYAMRNPFMFGMGYGAPLGGGGAFDFSNPLAMLGRHNTLGAMNAFGGPTPANQYDPRVPPNFAPSLTDFRLLRPRFA